MATSTTCPYCGVGCGLLAHDNTGTAAAQVIASSSHPANLGRLCSKGSALADTLDTRGKTSRLTQPTINGEECDWSTATQAIAARIQASIDQHGPDSVAFYLSGQLLTEDYYVVNKLAKGFLGTANVDTNSRLCMASAVAAYKRAFGADTVPCNYEDIECADLLVLVGSNAAWTHPVLYQRMVAAKQANPNLKVVLVDPRKTATADLADLHLAITPSSDNFLFQGLLNFLARQSLCDRHYIDTHTSGFEQAVAAASECDLAAVAGVCGVSQDALSTFYQWFADTPKTVSFYSQGVNQSATGTDKCNAIINCHLATGKLGYEGAGPFSITGQPNAMGGREVGGLANTLAAHMDFTPENIDRVQRFWQAPNMATQVGLKAVDLFDAIEQGRIKVLWIMATNPAVSLPDSQRIRQALAACDTVIVSDVTETDTTAYADILLPALAWAEKNGTVTNSERRISRQRAFREPQGSAKSDWWAVAEVAKQLGFADAFEFSSAADIFTEHAALSAFENNGQRDFDIGGLSHLSTEQYDALRPIQWPVNTKAPQGTARMFTDGRFYTSSGKAQFVCSAPQLAAAMADAERSSKLVLNSGRVRDQWHTMTRTGAVPTLTGRHDTAFVEVNPKDALARGLKHKSIARLSNAYGEASLQVNITESVKVGEAFAPIHWNQQFANSATINELFAPTVDPVSGQPESKTAAVEVTPMLAKYWARIVSKVPLTNRQRFAYWSVNRFTNGYVTLLGFNHEHDWKTEWGHADGVSTVEYSNPLRHTYSAVLSQDDQINAIVFQASCASKLPSRTWLTSLAEAKLLGNESQALRGEQGIADELICACFGTTVKALEQAVTEGANSQDELARRLGCGSKCGSCKPEINQRL